MRKELQEFFKVDWEDPEEEIVFDESGCFNCMINKKQSEMALNFEKNYTIKDLKFLLF